MKTIMIYEGETIQSLPSFYMEDFGQRLDFHIINENTSAVDLTGYTVKIKAISLYDGSTLFFKTCTVSDETAGYCYFIVSDTDFSEYGTFICELELTMLTNKETISLGHLNLLENV